MVKKKPIYKPGKWRAEVWRFPERLLHCMPLYQILILSSGIWWTLLLVIRCLRRQNITGATCILFYTHFPYTLLYNVLLQWTCIISAPS